MMTERNFACYFQTLGCDEGATCVRLGPVSFAPRGSVLLAARNIQAACMPALPRSTPLLCGPLYTDELPRKICQTKLILDTNPGKDSACVWCNLPYLPRNRQPKQRRDSVSNHNKLVKCF
jgi:hypothetical protein